MPVIAVSDVVVSCWVALLTGLAVAAIAWSVVAAVRVQRRQRAAGRRAAAIATVALTVVWTCASLAAVSFGVGVLLPR